MSTPTRTRTAPASGLKQKQSVPPSAAQFDPSFRGGDAINYQAWVAKAAKQPMVLETIDLGPLGMEDVEVATKWHCNQNSLRLPPPKHRTFRQFTLAAPG